MTRTVLFAANRGYALASSRTNIIGRFLKAQWRVVLATADDADARQLARRGAVLEPVRFDRGGVSVAGDWRAWRRLVEIHRRWRPRLAHHFHAKPIILGALAARRGGREDVSVINTITGLGRAYASSRGLGLMADFGYGAALSRSDMTIFQNRDDLAQFLDSRLVDDRAAELIPGSGVDLERFGFVNRAGTMHRRTVVFAARLLWEKGIAEFAEVARLIRQSQPEVRFVVAGEAEPEHPDAVPAEWLQQQHQVEYVGHLADVRALLAESDVLLCPSSYGEGVPRIVVEAAATGMPTVAFDVPGVREAACNGETGYLVPDKDTNGLRNRVEKLLEDDNRRLAMGRGAREMAEAHFDIRAIQEQYFDVYRRLGIDI